MRQLPLDLNAFRAYSRFTFAVYCDSLIVLYRPNYMTSGEKSFSFYYGPIRAANSYAR